MGSEEGMRWEREVESGEGMGGGERNEETLSRPFKDRPTHSKRITYVRMCTKEKELNVARKAGYVG